MTVGRPSGRPVYFCLLRGGWGIIPSNVATIDKIRTKFWHGDYEFAIPHFFEEMLNDQLDWADIQKVIRYGKIRQKFTHDLATKS